jgi:hypothetical protein
VLIRFYAGQDYRAIITYEKISRVAGGAGDLIRKIQTMRSWGMAEPRPLWIKGESEENYRTRRPAEALDAKLDALAVAVVTG